jgi:hypothetical protein
VLPRGAQHGQEEILADCDLTDARKGKMMTKHMLETVRSSATQEKAQIASKLAAE